MVIISRVNILSYKAQQGQILDIICLLYTEHVYRTWAKMKDGRLIFCTTVLSRNQRLIELRTSGVIHYL